MITLHLSVEGSRLVLWGEVRAQRRRATRRADAIPRHPYAARKDDLLTALSDLGIPVDGCRPRIETLWLPTADNMPYPSTALIAEAPTTGEAQLAPWRVDAAPLTCSAAIHLLAMSMETAWLSEGVLLSDSLRYFASVLRLAADLVVRQRYVPGILAEDGDVYARWEPVLTGEDALAASELAAALPGAARAISEGDTPPDRPAAAAFQGVIASLVDHLARPVGPATVQAKAASNEHEQWLAALRSADGRMAGGAGKLKGLINDIRSWRRKLSLSLASPYRLVFRIDEPEADDGAWPVHYLVHPIDDPSLLVPAGEVGKARGRKTKLLKRGDTPPEHYLLTALGAAATVSPDVEGSLSEGTPEGFDLDNDGAYRFLNETAPLLEGMGYGVNLPACWTRRGARMRLAARARESKSAATQSSGRHLSLDDVLNLDWTVAVEGEEVTYKELVALAKMKASLVRWRGQWVELNREDLNRALALLSGDPSEVTGRELLRMAAGGLEAPGGLAVESVEVEGELGDLLGQLGGRAEFTEQPTPRAFEGTLRPYQVRGYSWLAFLRRWGLGACLADDMGLGKTIQTLALIQADAEKGVDRPVLLVCPTSVIQNWRKEAERFTPELDVLIHHGPGRARGKEFIAEARRNAIVVSSYALLHGDLETLSKVPWAGVILDEAQNIKNPGTKTAKAARALRADYRIALTGTPVENHVGELWSIMEFLNTGLLGSAKDFHTDFFVPIQARRDEEATARLKRLSGPFVLRRLKTDRSIITDLPEKQEMSVYCPLTKEQATLYVAVTEEATEALKDADDMKRRGVVLATLSKLKQVCNHPAQFLGNQSIIAGRSGKLERLREMLEEVLLIGERALIFSQFSEMGQILKTYLEDSFGREVSFLHGGVSRAKRDQMVESFQEDADAPRLFVLSLKAGGTGLNLTRANHVFHYDRWWNPAVENQATDRVFRIGQTRDVQVHKFVCAGTVEEKIEAMIEAKREIAEQVVGTGEASLTELSTEELRDLFALDARAVQE